MPGTVAVWIPYRIAARAGPGLVLGPSRLIWSAPFLLIGAGLYFWCLWEFDSSGRGTPAPIDPPKRLVVRGPYRHVRNPMYLGILMIVAGWAAAVRSAGILEYGVGVALVFHLVVVLMEEPLLRRRFGAGYEADCRDVGRWVPGRAFERRAELE